MRKVCFICLLFLSLNINAQQIIWSTAPQYVRNNGRHITLNEVEEEIFTLFTQYNYYYINTEHDIDFFLQSFGPDFMLAHLPKGAIAMQLSRNNFEQVQVLIFVLYFEHRISGWLYFSDNKDHINGIETSEQNKKVFLETLNSLWFNIEGIDY